MTFSFTGGNSWYVWGVSDNGQINGMLYNSGTSIRLVKDSLFMIGKRDMGLKDPIVDSAPLWAKYENEDLNTAVTTMLALRYDGPYLGYAAIGFATNDATFYADVD